MTTNEVSSSSSKSDLFEHATTEAERQYLRSSHVYNTYDFNQFRELGRGGYGIVFSGVKRADGTLVAVKRLKFSRNVSICNETMWMYHCQLFTHPNAMAIYDMWVENPPAGLQQRLDKVITTKKEEQKNFSSTIGTEDDSHYYHPAIKISDYSLVPDETAYYRYFEMELCNKGTLKDFINDLAQLDEEKFAVKYVKQKEEQILKGLLDICSGIAFLQEINVHVRDIKAENIMLHQSREDNSSLVFKVTDFGLTTYAEKSKETQRKSQLLFKTFVKNEVTNMTHARFERSIASNKKTARSHETCLEKWKHCLNFNSTFTPTQTEAVFDSFVDLFRKYYNHQAIESFCLVTKAHENSLLIENSSALHANTSPGSYEACLSHLLNNEITEFNNVFEQLEEEDQQRVLSACIVTGRRTLFEDLLRNNNNVYTQRWIMLRNKKPLLHLAVEFEEEELVKSMIENHECPVNAVDDNGNTVFSIASREMAKVLLQYQQCDVNVYVRDKYGQLTDTLLHRSIKSKDFDLLPAILDHKQCDLNAENKTGQTAFDVAIMEESVEVLLTLELDCHLYH